MNNRRKWQRLAAGVLLTGSSLASAQTPVEGDLLLRDFRFRSSEQLSELRLHYTTVGSAAGEPVLLLHGTGGSGTGLLATMRPLFAAGQALDTAKYFVILPDAIGHGKSSKPSEGLGTRFPRYNYDDMVRAQYRLLTEHLGVKHLRLVLGNSMGGMLTWLWGEEYPAFMDVLAPLASEPSAMGGRNWMMRRMVIDAIRHDPNWQGGNYARQPTAWHWASVYSGVSTSGGARALYFAYPTSAAADAELDGWLARAVDADANDVLYQLESARDYNPAPGLDRIKARVLVINSADDERNPPELGIIEKVVPRLKGSRYVLLPITEQSRGHATTANVALWKDYLAQMLAERP